MKLISDNGSYIRTKFESKGVKWQLVGSESIHSEVNTRYLTNEQKIEQILITVHDTFKSEKGEYITKMRLTIKKLCDDGKIIALD